MKLTNALRTEYMRLWQTCQVTRPADVNAQCTRLLKGMSAYTEVASVILCPWYMVGVVHILETGGRWDAHLHNGDPLQKRTTHVPAGQPMDGDPPFTWVSSAIDALTLKRWDRVGVWREPEMLYQLEAYNGWGYRAYHSDVLSPYLWAGSDHYSRGKYVADGKWSANAVSKQIGAAVLLRRLAERGDIEIQHPSTPWPMIHYGPGKPRPQVATMQAWLNSLPGIALKVDGHAGPLTSQAVHQVFGEYLVGDPRRTGA